MERFRPATRDQLRTWAGDSNSAAVPPPSRDLLEDILGEMEVARDRGEVSRQRETLGEEDGGDGFGRAA